MFPTTVSGVVDVGAPRPDNSGEKILGKTVSESEGPAEILVLSLPNTDTRVG